MTVLSWSYFAAAALVLYSYLLYPLILRVLAPRIGRYTTAPTRLDDSDLPTVTCLIAAHNEADEIAQRIENLLAMDYPADRLQILIASDGSSDDTYAIASRYDDPRLHIEQHFPNIGKSATLNRYLPQARGELVVMSDANTNFSHDVLRALVRWFVDPQIIAVSGKLNLLDPVTGNNVDSAYWRYENSIKRLEGMLGAKLGANGAIYAFRKKEFVPFPRNTIVDDFVIPLMIKLRRGGFIVFDPEAQATEPTPEAIGEEFKRRVRIGTGAYQSLQLLWRLILPRHGWAAFCFISHKLLRWLTPFLLVYMILLSAVGIQDPVFRTIAILELLAGILVWLGFRSTGDNSPSRLLRTLSMFAAMNAALLLGFWRFLTTEQSGTWTRTSRTMGDKQE